MRDIYHEKLDLLWRFLHHLLEEDGECILGPFDFSRIRKSKEVYLGIIPQSINKTLTIELSG